MEIFTAVCRGVCFSLLMGNILLSLGLETNFMYFNVMTGLAGITGALGWMKIDT